MDTKNQEVLQIGHPTLRQIAQPVDLPINIETREFIHLLLAQMKQDNGVGIAAPQLGRSQQIVIIASRPNLRYPNAPKMDPCVMLNPRITAYSAEREMGWEGCLSVPSLRGQVMRATCIEVNYTNLENQTQQKTFEGFVARIIQHECDHLIGKLFLDRVPSTEHLMSEAEFFRQII